MNVMYEPSSGTLWVAISTTRAPVSSAIASAMSSGVPTSLKMTGTPSASTLAFRSARSDADACACELSDGISAPTMRKS